MKKFKGLGFLLFLGVSIFAADLYAAAPVVEINFIVLRNRRNQGNTDYVTKKFLNRVADYTTKISKNKVKYKVAKITYLKNDDLYYQKNELKILKKLKSYAKKGYVNAIYTNDDTNATGRALITGSCCSKPTYNKKNKYRYYPSIVFHSRKRNDSDASVHSASTVMIHELGHHIGFHHKSSKTTLHGDNYYKVSAGIKHHVAWAKKMQSYRPKAASTSASNSKSTGKQSLPTKQATERKPASTSKATSSKATSIWERLMRKAGLAKATVKASPRPVMRSYANLNTQLMKFNRFSLWLNPRLS